ncbi:MAG: hypothetical protein PHE15_01570 [Dehalococcoidales bacterium]|nr:hypothetical protein [Dehalococcoidales bacterium]
MFLKAKQVFRPFPVIFILALLFITSLPVSAASNITLSSNTGAPGSTITVTGSFDTVTTGAATISFNGTYMGLANISAGSFTGTFKVPALQRGTYLVSVETAGSSERVYTQFTIVPKIIISASTVYVGEQISITGNGFSMGPVSFYLDNSSAPLITTSTDVSGILTPITITVPPANKATHILRAVDVTGFASSTYATFDVIPKIALTTLTGSAGDQIGVTGTGFASLSQITIKLNGTAVNNLSSIKTDNTGSFSTTFTVPSTISRGDCSIMVTDNDNNFTTTILTIRQSIALSETSGSVGDTITISGTSFAANKTVTIYFYYEKITTAQTNSYGSFTVDITIPSIAQGTYTIKAMVEDEYGNQATATFTIKPKIALGTDSGVYEDTIIITGTGFSAGNTFDNNITFNLDNTTALNIENVYTDLTGSFTATFIIGNWVNGKHAITAEDDYGNIAETNIKVTAYIQLDIATGVADDIVKITGTGFATGKQITIKYNGVVIPATPTTITTDTNGGFTASFTVPDTAAGTYTVEAGDGTNSAGKSFVTTIETDPPAAFTLISPINSSKFKQPITFNWSASSDKNGVTYELEIATDAGFTSIIMGKNGLATTEYTMDDEAKLNSVSAKSPYYWRVRAIDGVGNTSDWTTDTFIVGFIWSSWLTYLLCGIVALPILVVLGIRVGKKLATSRDDRSYNYDIDIEDRYKDQYQDKTTRGDR